MKNYVENQARLNPYSQYLINLVSMNIFPKEFNLEAHSMVKKIYIFKVGIKFDVISLYIKYKIF